MATTSTWNDSQWASLADEPFQRPVAYGARRLTDAG